MYYRKLNQPTVKDMDKLTTGPAPQETLEQKSSNTKAQNLQG
jgi:hypothetical protein